MINTETSSLISLNQDFLLEFVNTNIGYTTLESKLYLHNNMYVGANKVQVLGDDAQYLVNGNSRKYSFYSDFNNTDENFLLDPTPFSFTDLESNFHAASEITTLTSKVPYKIVRLYVRAGWQFPAGSPGFMLKLGAKYNGKKIELLNFFAPSNTNLFKPTSKNLYVNESLYSSYIEFKILDLSDLSTTGQSDLQDLFLALTDLVTFGSYNQALLSNYLCEFYIVESSDLVVDNLSGSNTGGNSYNFNKITVNNWITNTKFLTDTLNQLQTNVQAVNSVLEINLQSSGSLSVEQQLLTLTSDLQYIQIDHYVVIEELDSGLSVIGTRETRVSNILQEWASVQFIPIIQDLTDSLRIKVRTRIQAFDKGYDISKYSELTISGTDVQSLRRSIATGIIQVTTNKIVNQLNQQIVQVTGNSPAQTTIKLKPSTIFVFSNTVNVTNVANNESQEFESIDVNKSVILYAANSVYSFEFLLNGVPQTLPSYKLYIAETGGIKQYFEIDRVDTKVLFRLNSSLFTKKHFEIYDDQNQVIASFKIVNQ